MTDAVVMGADALIHRRDAHERGVTDAEIRRLVATRRWIRLASGVYVPCEAYDAADEYRRHELRARAVLATASPDAVLSHVSAAVLHGLRPWNIPLDDVHIARNRPTGGRRRDGRVLHSASFREVDVADVGGTRVLSPAKTVTDLAATVPFDRAVVVGDQALRNGLVDLDEVRRAVDDMGSHPGRARAARAVRFMCERSDSVGESLSRARMVGEQLPVPLTQVDVFDEEGRWLARVDFLFPEHGVVGEFDGRIKYRRDGVATDDAENVVYREKLREDGLRHAGWVVVRWTWSDLSTPGVLAARLRGGFELAARGPGPVGRFTTGKLTDPVRGSQHRQQPLAL
ncbi:type IV toxin-antitoxin system AbiEi family antitoxin domain-containing protein [Rhodococcus yananensis]|uniref:type IV toxin-antitoxin system AbiEi family antitoxin domain-containing protein n=1 Tax=Rhodococcus yananensis TaxID=2879464 RepID=UPI001CF87CA1|nr:hypothetical protein [Rhodococcus yananensis]